MSNTGFETASNNQDIAWALAVRESYNEQLEDGVSEPRMDEDLFRSMPNVNAINELGKLGLFTAEYQDGFFIEPESVYPRYHDELTVYRGGIKAEKAKAA